MVCFLRVELELEEYELVQTHGNPELVILDDFEDVFEGDRVAGCDPEVHVGLLRRRQSFKSSQLTTFGWLHIAVEIVCEG